MKNYLAVTLMTAAGFTGQNASAGNFRSLYTETLSCPVTEEGEDAFTRECSGPGNVKAILQYVDGLFGVFYLPATHNAPMERGDMLEVSPTARLPYGSKHEWRVREGESRPCAAIIRAYTIKGERLVVTDLATGIKVGLATTNAQATALADKACSANHEASSQPSEVSEDATPSKPDTVVDVQSIAQAVALGKSAFSDAYVQTGISGAIEQIEACYGKITTGATPSSLATCAAMDIVAANVDTQMTSSYPGLAQPFFGGTKPDDRIAHGMRVLQLDQGQQQRFEAQLAESLGASPPKATNAEQQKSVFNFSK